MEKVGVGMAYLPHPHPSGIWKDVEAAKSDWGGRGIVGVPSQITGSRVPSNKYSIAHTSSILSRVLACHLLVRGPGLFTSKIGESHVGGGELTLKDTSHALGAVLTA